MKLFGKGLSLSATIGFTIVGATVVTVLFAPWIAPYGQAEFVGDVWAPPSSQWWLGLDNLGRDLLSRTIYGGRTSASLAFVITALAFLIGITAGFSAAVLGRMVDLCLSRFVDVFMAVPQLILALIILGALGTSIPVLITTIAVVESTRIFRVSRAVALEISVLEFVEVARLRGDPLWWILVHEILPSAIPPLAAEFGLRFCYTLLFVSSLSFLGLGVQPPQADWGSMVRDNALAITIGGMAPIFPALAISILAIGVNLVVDWYLSVRGRRSETEGATVDGQ